MRRLLSAGSALLGALASSACSTPSYVQTDDHLCAQSAECVAYLAELEQRVHREWYPFGAESGSVELVFELSSDGEVTDLSVVRGRARGGLRGLDDSCETAFLAATPFDPPPPEITSTPVHLTFALGVN